MQDRLRLKLNPPNVAVPTGARDFYVNADGNLVKESPDGTNSVVGAGNTPAPVVIEARQGTPNYLIPEVIHIEGPASPVSLTRGADQNGYATWGSDPNRVAWTVGVWEIILPGYTVDKQSDTLSPVGLEDWNVSEGENQPVVTGEITLTATAIGQECIVGSGQPLVFKACNPINLAAWQLVGPAGVIEDNENPGQYLRIVSDNGAPTFENYTVA